MCECRVDYKSVKYMKSIAIVDYGMGNLMSVRRAFECVGCKTRLVTTGIEVRKADYLVLPGVGAFGDAMMELSKRDLVRPIKEYCKQNRPFLGICLGMQLMLDASEESENITGLGIIEGSVMRLTACTEADMTYKVPNIGWYRIKVQKSPTEIMNGIADEDRFYFVHSYGAYPVSSVSSVASLQYGSNSFSVVVRRGNCYGTQFHPEKSGKTGLKLIHNFVSL